MNGAFHPLLARDSLFLRSRSMTDITEEQLFSWRRGRNLIAIKKKLVSRRKKITQDTSTVIKLIQMLHFPTLNEKLMINSKDTTYTIF